MSSIASLLLLLAIPLTPSCASKWYAYRFLPAPLEVRLAARDDPAARGRALVTVDGIARADEAEGARVVVRFRFENQGTQPLRVDVASFRLVTAGLVELGPVRLESAPERAIAGGEEATFAAIFALPAGREPSDLDLRGLNLEWSIDYGGERIGTGITFERWIDPRPMYWHDPFYCWPHSHVGLHLRLSHPP